MTDHDTATSALDVANTDLTAAGAAYRAAREGIEAAAFRVLVLTAADCRIASIDLDVSDQGPHMTLAHDDFDADIAEVEALEDAAYCLPDEPTAPWATRPGVIVADGRRFIVTIDVATAVAALTEPTEPEPTAPLLDDAALSTADGYALSLTIDAIRDEQTRRAEADLADAVLAWATAAEPDTGNVAVTRVRFETVDGADFSRDQILTAYDARLFAPDDTEADLSEADADSLSEDRAVSDALHELSWLLRDELNVDSYAEVNLTEHATTVEFA